MKAVTPLAAALTLATAGSVHAQTWTPISEAPRGMVAASARWPSGITLVSRCQNGRDLALILTLAEPIAQRTVRMTVAVGEEDPYEATWRLSENGRLLFVRQPGHFSRALINQDFISIQANPEDGPLQRYELESPQGVEALADVVTACGHPTTSPIGESSVVTNPDWVRRPNGGHLAGAYPSEAARRGIGGEAVIECLVALDGRVEDCIVVSESPEGMGFGAATIAISREFRMRPQRVDGRPYGETMIRIPISWRIG